MVKAHTLAMIVHQERHEGNSRGDIKAQDGRADIDACMELCLTIDIRVENEWIQGLFISRID